MTRAPAAAAAALIAAALASTSTIARPAQDTPPANTVPGLTLWAWRLDGQLPRWPRVDDGQTPNAYRVVTSVAAIRDPIAADDGPLADRFAGELRGWLRIDAPESREIADVEKAIAEAEEAAAETAAAEAAAAPPVPTAP
jgi:hypothetical protein